MAKRDPKKLSKTDVIAMMLDIHDSASATGRLKLEVCEALLVAVAPATGDDDPALAKLAEKLLKKKNASA